MGWVRVIGKTDPTRPASTPGPRVDGYFNYTNNNLSAN